MTESKENTQDAAEEEITEFEPDAPHPDTPQSVLEEQGFEDRGYEGTDDDKASEETWEELKERKTRKHVLKMRDPDEPSKTLTFVYRKIAPGDEMLLDDIAIVTGIIFNRKHEKVGDTLEKAVEENRVEEFIQVTKNNIRYENKIMSLALGKPIEEIEETITHPQVRFRCIRAFKGGAVPRSEDDPQTDVDTFPPKTTEQGPREEASAD